MAEGMNLKALFIVVNAGFAESTVDIARALGATGATIINARGIGPVHKSILGITVDTEKEMILTLVEKDKADKIVAAIREKAGVSSPVNGICFILPVECATGLGEAARFAK